MLDAAPPVARFEQWITEHVRDHRSNVSHPLFRFLREEATFDQLRAFFFQETPFDIFHADLITLMMPGVYGVMKEELAKNFWDEMGAAHADEMHRTIRIDTARSLGLDTDAHVARSSASAPRSWRWPTCTSTASPTAASCSRHRHDAGDGDDGAGPDQPPDRGLPPQRVDGAQIHYLTMHAEVDIVHGAGWMRNVVMPLLEAHPMALREVLLGVERRLYRAGAVCDRMLTYLPEAASAPAGVA